MSESGAVEARSDDHLIKVLEVLDGGRRIPLPNDKRRVNEENVAPSRSVLMPWHPADLSAQSRCRRQNGSSAQASGMPMPRRFTVGRVLTSPLSLRAQLLRGEIVSRIVCKETRTG